MKNFIVRTITAVFFVAAIVSCFLRAEAMILLFALVTGLTIWEFTGLVNDRENISVNRLMWRVCISSLRWQVTTVASHRQGRSSPTSSPSST